MTADQPPTEREKYSTTQQGRWELAHCSKSCQGRYPKSEVMAIASHQLYVTCHILWSSTWFQQQSPVTKDSVKRHYVAHVWLSGGVIKWDHLCLIIMECCCPSDSCETIIVSLLDILFEIHTNMNSRVFNDLKISLIHYTESKIYFLLTKIVLLLHSVQMDNLAKYHNISFLRNRNETRCIFNDKHTAKRRGT